MRDSRPMGNVSTNVYAKFRCAPLRIKKASVIFRELITTRRTTRVAFWDPPSGSKINNPKVSFDTSVTSADYQIMQVICK